MSKADKLLKRVEFYEKMASSQKPENEDLLKKASLYERLALYSDRKSFLSALAGGATSSWGAKQHSDAEIKAALQKVIDGIAQWNNQYGTRLADASGSPRILPKNVAQDQYNVLQALNVPSLDLNTLNTIYKSLSNLAQLNNKGFESDALQAWGQLVFGPAGTAQQVVGEQISVLNEVRNNIPPDTSGEGGSGTLQMPEQTIEGKPEYPPINRADQQAVFNFATTDGGLKADPKKQQADGALGPETRKALEAIKNYFAKTYPNNKRMTDQQAITAAKAPRRG